MRIFATLICVCAILSLCLAVVTAEDMPAPPPAPDAVAESAPAPPPAPDAAAEPTPAPPATPDAVDKPAPTHVAPSPMAVPRPPMGSAMVGRKVILGTTESQGAPKRERGMLTIIPMPPANLKVASVEVYCDSTLIGKKTEAPYELQFNTTTVTDAVHAFKAVGLDAGGKQVWMATTKIDVRNTGFSGAPGNPGSASVMPPVAPRPPVVSKKPAAATTARGAVVPTGSKTYTSAKYGFSVAYPAGWTAKDQSTSMRPRKAGNVWIAFTPASKKGTLAVNVRRMRLDPNSSADVFAKYNPYVAKWERKTMGDSQAFATTTTVSPKKVIHRLIMIKNGYAWMLNCIDSSGQPSDGSQKLFQSVVDSLEILVPVPAKSKAMDVIRVK